MHKSLKAGLLAAVMALVAVVGVNAQTKPNMAIFDAQQVINGTNAAKRAVSELTGKRNAAQAQIDALEKPLLEKQQKLRGQQQVMAADKFQQAQVEFAKELTTFRQQAQKIQNDLDEQNLKLRKQIADSVKAAVESIAKEKGYDIVIPKGVTFYTSAQVPDISVEALTRANKLLDK